MKIHYTIILLFLIPCTIVSQTVTGKVYDEDSTVKGAKIYNTTKQTLNFSNDSGSFTINTSIGDTLQVSSLFHNKKTIIIKAYHFENPIVIELKKVVNNLDEVLVYDNQKEFNLETYNNTINNELKQDLKDNPDSYEPPPTGNMDFVKIAELLVKLIKKKKSKKAPIPIVNITQKQLDSLFSTDNYFNEQLLTIDLKVPNEYKFLFFDYCSAQNLDSKLLLKDNEFLLLNELTRYSETFLKHLSEFKD